MANKNNLPRTASKQENTSISKVINTPYRLWTFCATYCKKQRNTYAITVLFENNTTIKITKRASIHHLRAITFVDG